jgi:hypothetical protein
MLSSTYQTANDSTHIEDAPEPGKVTSLLVLQWIGKHDGTLSRPQKTGTHTKKSTGEDVETSHICVDRDKQADSVNGITNTSKSQGDFHTQAVHKGSTKESKDSKGAVDGNVL